MSESIPRSERVVGEYNGERIDSTIEHARGNIQDMIDNYFNKKLLECAIGEEHPYRFRTYQNAIRQFHRILDTRIPTQLGFVDDTYPEYKAKAAVFIPMLIQVKGKPTEEDTALLNSYVPTSLLKEGDFAFFQHIVEKSNNPIRMLIAVIVRNHPTSESQERIREILRLAREAQVEEDVKVAIQKGNGIVLN